MRIIPTSLVIVCVAAAMCVSAGTSQDKAKTQDSANDKRTRRFTISKETTYVTKPVDKDGYIDYVAAMNERLKQGATPEKNAVVLLMKALGPRFDKDVRPAEFFKCLGVEAPPDDGAYYRPAAAYLKMEFKLDLARLFDQWDQIVERPWTAKEYPHFAAWIGANEKPLALVVEATKREHYYLPFVATESEKHLVRALPYGGMMQFRDLAHLLTSRANFRIGQKRYDDAWQDLLACYRLGRLVARGETYIEALVGIDIYRVAATGTVALLAAPEVDAKRIKLCLRDLHALPLNPMMAEKVIGERLIVLDVIQRLDREGLQSLVTEFDPRAKRFFGGSADPQAKRFLQGIDWSPALRKANAWFDRQVAALREKDRTARAKILARIDSDMESLQKKVDAGGSLAELMRSKDKPAALSDHLGDVVVSFLVSSARLIPNGPDQSEQVQGNLDIAFALAFYQRDNGRFPMKLDGLVPKYLPKIPLDLFSGKPLVYRPSATGYLLYSVGPNGQDDETRGALDDPSGDDIVVRVPPRSGKKE